MVLCWQKICHCVSPCVRMQVGNTTVQPVVDHRISVQDLQTYLFTYLVTYLLTPWSRVLLEMLTGPKLVKKFPSFYEPEGS